MQLRDLDAAAVFDEVIAEPPGGVEELGTLDDNLREMDACASWYLLGQDVDASTQAKDEPRVFPIEDNVPAGKQHLSG